MINSTTHPADWPLLLIELQETAEHLQSMIDEMAQTGEISEDKLFGSTGPHYDT